MAILRYEENGIEFFTLQDTGESGMSQSGLARLCGVSRQAIQKLLDSVSTSLCPEFLKSLQDKDLILRASVNEFKNATIIKDTVCAHILEWYAFESQRPSETARQAFRKFASIGIRTWIQNITGWETEKVSVPLPSAPVETTVVEFDGILQELSALEHSLLVALKHRHAIHNLVEQPTVVDLSLQQIVHTAVHVQAHKLNFALKQVAEIRQLVSYLKNYGPKAEVSNIPELSLIDQIEQLKLENNALIERVSKLQGRRSTLSYSPEEAKMGLEHRIEWLTAALLKLQKRPNSDRAMSVCRLRATIFARYEWGESLTDIADDLGLIYDTAKKYLKVTRRLLRPQLVK